MITTNFLIIVSILTLLIKNSFAQDPYLVEGRNGGLNQAIQDRDDEPEDLFATNFGAVTSGTQETRDFRITNTSTTDLEIIGISSSSSTFTVTPTSIPNGGIISSRSFLNFTITFAAGVGDAESIIEITTDAAGNFEVFQFLITGEGVPRLFVDAAATGANNGTSWSNAFVHLQDGLAAAASGDEVLIAEGCLLYTSPSPRDQRGSRMPSSA